VKETSAPADSAQGATVARAQRATEARIPDRRRTGRITLQPTRQTQHDTRRAHRNAQHGYCLGKVDARLIAIAGYPAMTAAYWGSAPSRSGPSDLACYLKCQSCLRVRPP
jgi:hypothetical protein